MDPTSFLYQRIWLELIFFLGAIWGWYRNLNRVSKEISLYVILSLLLPTLTGTLSSISRYTLVLVPFLLPPKLNKISYFLLYASNCLLLIYLFFQILIKSMALFSCTYPPVFLIVGNTSDTTQFSNFSAEGNGHIQF